MPKNLLHLFCVLFCSLVLCGCQSSPPFECPDAIGCVEIGPEDPLTIGVIQALSGPVSNIGIEQTRAIELALSARENQFLGHPIALSIEDGQCSSEGGKVAAMKLVADPQIIAILGTTCSGSAAAITEIVSEAGSTMISATNTAISLTSFDGQAGEHWRPGYFRTSSNDAAAAQIAATFVFEELGLRKVATIDDGDTYTRSYTDAFHQVFRALGGKLVLDATIDKGDRDMRPVLKAVVQAGAELVFLPLFSPEADFIVLQALQEAALKNTRLMGGGALVTDAFIASVGSAGEGIYIASADPLANPAVEELMNRYETHYEEKPLTNALGRAYDATHLLLHALERAAIHDQDGTLHIGRQALRDALYATSDLAGVTGRLDCDPFGDCSAVEFVILRLDDPSAGLEGLRSNIVYTHTRGVPE